MTIYCTDGFGGKSGESHRLLTEAIAEYTRDRVRAAEMTGSMYTGKNGKPYIDGFDFFSISHTGSVWAVLFCMSECGLDVQLARKCQTASIAEKFFHPDDADAVAAAAGGQMQNEGDVFFRLWARREALIKAAGGSVADRSTPSVLDDSVSYGGEAYGICDVSMPDLPGVFAAACVKGGRAAVPEILRLGQRGGN